jgi:hypothetical protein
MSRKIFVDNIAITPQYLGHSILLVPLMGQQMLNQMTFKGEGQA